VSIHTNSFYISSIRKKEQKPVADYKILVRQRRCTSIVVVQIKISPERVVLGWKRLVHDKNHQRNNISGELAAAERASELSRKHGVGLWNSSRRKRLRMCVRCVQVSSVIFVGFFAAKQQLDLSRRTTIRGGHRVALLCNIAKNIFSQGRLWESCLVKLYTSRSLALGVRGNESHQKQWRAKLY
jgi:hypothetical protein